MNATRRLLVAVLALAALDGAVWFVRREVRPEPLPSVLGFDPAAATAVRLVGPEDPIALVRTADGWQLTAPVDAPADPVEINAVVSALAGGIRPDLRIGDTDHARYGLDGGTELRVEVEGAAGRLSAFYLGADTDGGATWIRLPDTDDVYRARIGGRARFDRPPGAWRDRRVTDVDPAAVTAVTVTGAGGTFGAVRGPEGWAGTPAPVDGPTMERLVAELARLRAAEVLAPGPDDEPGPTVELRTADGPIRLTFGRDGAQTTVRRDDGALRWRVVAPWLDRLADPTTFRDRTLWVATRVDRFELRAPGRDGILARDTDGWRIVRPANVDVDPARADAIAAWLARPRVLAWAPADAPFVPERRWEITTDGQLRPIELGAVQGDRVPIRVDGRVGWIEARVVTVAEGLFGG